MRKQMSVPVAIAAQVYKKGTAWVRAGLISGYLPIGCATRNGEKICSVEEIGSSKGRINYYISPKLLFEQTGFKWGDYNANCD